MSKIRSRPKPYSLIVDELIERELNKKKHEGPDARVHSYYIQNLIEQYPGLMPRIVSVAFGNGEGRSDSPNGDGVKAIEIGVRKIFRYGKRKLNYKYCFEEDEHNGKGAYWIYRKNDIDETNLYEYQGEKKTLLEWSDLYNVDYNLLFNRINNTGWDIERAINTPIRNYQRHTTKRYKWTDRLTELTPYEWTPRAELYEKFAALVPEDLAIKAWESKMSIRLKHNIKKYQNFQPRKSESDFTTEEKIKSGREFQFTKVLSNACDTGRIEKHPDNPKGRNNDHKKFRRVYPV